MGFSLGGLITGAMKGVGEGYTTVAKGELENQQKLSLEEKLLQMREEKDRRVAEFQDDLQRRGKIKDIEQVDPLRAQSDANRERVVGAARTEVEVGREDALRPGKIKTAVDTKTAELDVETDVTKRRGSDPTYLKSKQRITEAGEGSAARATAASASFELAQKKAVADLRTQLSKLPKDDPAREPLTQQIQDLSGGSSKSYADMVTAGDSFRKLAQSLRKDAESATSEAEAKAMLERAQLYEEQAAGILGSTVTKRLGSGATAPSNGTQSVVKKPAQPKPWERNWNSPQ